LPEFLPTFRVGTPAICIVFDIFIGEDCFECPASMIKIQHILSEKSIGVKSRKEQFIDPLIDTLADFYEFVGRSEISGDNHPSGAGRPSSRLSQPPSKSSTTTPVLTLVIFAVGGWVRTCWMWGCCRS
jgi:hypothetical protein